MGANRVEEVNHFHEEVVVRVAQERQSSRRVAVVAVLALVVECALYENQINRLRD
jgi:hypothetical protein